jgi:hypothetical protein
LARELLIGESLHRRQRVSRLFLRDGFLARRCGSIQLRNTFSLGKGCRVARTIHCTVIEVPAMRDLLGSNLAGGFQDLVPWADPYIAALIENLRRAEDSAEEGEVSGAVDELPPPLGNDQDDRDEPWQADWSPRNWPRQS